MRGHCHHQIHFGFSASALVATSRLKVCSRIPKANLVKNMALLSRIHSSAVISFLCKDHSVHKDKLFPSYESFYGQISTEKYSVPSSGAGVTALATSHPATCSSS